jgi:hypothetical protein
MASLSNLLSHVAADPLPSLQQNGESLEQVELGGGDLLEMLVKPPSFDWTKMARVPKAGFSTVTDEPVSESYLGSYPAQVWLIPKMPAPRLPDLEPMAEEQPAPKMVATKEVSLPFQVPEKEADDQLADEVKASIESNQKQVNSIVEPKPALVETETADAIPSSIMQPEKEYKEPSFDQSALVSEQVLDSQLDRSKESRTQPSEAATGLPVQLSGLAGLVGAALILFSLGTMRLYLRWRSQSKSPDKPEPDSA